MTAVGAATAAPAVTSLRKDGRRRPFSRVLIANRGEIALRIIRACRDLGCETVAVYSDADSDAAHVRAADVAVRLGVASPAESYLAADRIVEAATASGADAIHPGYGFLSERSSFARRVRDSGVVWVGPSPATIAAVGDKLAARRLAASVGVPVVPGTLEPAVVRPDALDGLIDEASRIGFPMLVKAAAGGGGRGMRRVTDERALVEALAAGSAEAESAFGDGSVYLEREIRPARHVEVQLLGDSAGTVIAVGERDCSLQRRHQKLVEEAPAPGLEPAARRELHAMAVAIGRAAGLENAATAEFLLGPDGSFWFLEVNTRLQVEHGVTELVADVDLVAEQLWIAAGEPLSDGVVRAASHAASPERHAIEVRISAEDPSRGFAPTPGRVAAWQMPSGPGVRVDTAMEPDTLVPPDYDPMIAKLMVVGRNRDNAIDRLRRALDEVEITGIQTTLPFHRFVSRHDAFRAAELSTDWVAEEWDGEGERAAVSDVARRAAARIAARRSAATQLSLRKDSAATGQRWQAAGREHQHDRWPRR